MAKHLARADAESPRSYEGASARFARARGGTGHSQADLSHAVDELHASFDRFMEKWPPGQLGVLARELRNLANVADDWS
jgi:hypothetical protein